MKTAIRVEGLYKSYDGNQVIKGISFEVASGEIFALLGTNGAGKTTTLECIEGLRKYDKGAIEVSGKLGVQLQSSTLPAAIKAREALTLFSKWGGARTEPSAALGLAELEGKQYKSMSTGQKRRLHLALAMIGDPDIIFLDEPTAGLDVEGRAALHDEIRALHAKGKTIIMASHDMAEVESLCDRIAILKSGEIAFIGTADELTKHIGTDYSIRIKTDKGQDELTSGNIRDALLDRLNAYKDAGTAVLDIQIERSTLEQRFIDIAGRKDI